MGKETPHELLRADQLADDPEWNLLVDVAHDFRSPLTSILFLSESLRAHRGQPIGATEERQLMLIYSAAFELSTLANDLTELGHGGRGLLERQPVAFSAGDLLASVRDLVRPLAEEKGVEVRLAHPANAHHLGHPAALGRVLLNLAANALRCTDEGWVEVEMHPLDRVRVAFLVRDSGPGIPDELAATLRAPLERLPVPASRRLFSAGLGLLICRRLLAAMGSELEVSSGEEGTCFRFILDLPTARLTP